MSRRLLALPLAAFAALAPVHASAPTIRVSEAWIRVLPGDLPAGGYAALRNEGDEPVALLGARSPDYGEIMLHRSTSTGGLERMEPVARLTVPAHGAVALAPGGYHLMLMGPKRAVRPGDRVKVTLRFDDGRTITVAFLARPANATGPR